MDCAVFGETLLACHASLYRYARSLTRDPSSAEELVQETCRRGLAARTKPNPPTEANTRPWLFTILRHIWQNELRQRHRWAVADVDMTRLELDASPPDVLVTRKMLQYEVRQAIDSLPEPFREVVLLRDIEGLSYAEIANVLGCPAGTVMSRLSRARDQLRGILSVRAAEAREIGT